MVFGILHASGAALAQTAGEYYNFQYFSPTTNKIYVTGSLLVGSTSPNFSALDLPSSKFYTYDAQGVSTAYGITNAAALSGSSYGTYAGSTGAYYVASTNFGFTTTTGNHYALVGSVSAPNAARFDLYSATFANGIYTLGSSVYTNQKIGVVSTGAPTGSFSATSIAQQSSAPEIDGGNLAKGVLLFFCLVALAGGYRLRHQVRAKKALPMPIGFSLLTAPPSP